MRWAHVGLVDRWSRLLALEEEGGARSALEQDEVHAHAHASHPDHLADGVDLNEAVEEHTTILLQRVAVAGQQHVDYFVLLVVVKAHA
jgi:hypothetical protein